MLLFDHPSILMLWALPHPTDFTFCRTNDLILELESEIDEEIATKNALEIDGDGGDSNVEGDEFQLHINANKTEYQMRTVFKIDIQPGPMVSIFLQTKVQHKSMQ